MVFKVMLAVTAEMDKIKYPVYASYKLDGIRMYAKDGFLFTRSNKPIRNIKIREKFEYLKYITNRGIIVDGELYSHELTFQEITHFVMSENEELPEHLDFHCFDYINTRFPKEDFNLRYKKIPTDIKHPHVLINNKEELEAMFERALEAGYEGLILRGIDKPYKQGRSTLNEGGMLKIKPFVTFETKIMGVIERFNNTNESFTNELGRSTKRHTKDDREATGIAAAFVTEYEGNELKVVLTGAEEFRKEIWENKESYIGRIIEYKGMLIGAKDVPRHPVFLRFRHEEDIS